MSWTDEKIDELYRNRSNDLSFDYKGEYWEDMSSMLPATSVVNPEVSDVQVDQMYTESAASTKFTYKPEYWQTMEAMLPQRRRPDFLWFFASFLFLGFFGVLPFVNADINGKNEIQNALSTRNKQTIESSSPDSNENNLNSESTVTPFEWDPSSLVIDFPIGDFSNFNMPTCGGVIYDDQQFFPGIGWVNDQNVNTEKGAVDVLPLKAIEEDERSLANYPNIPHKVSSTVTGYLQAVGGLSQSLVSPSDALSYSYGIGLGAEFQNKNWSLGLGVNGIVSNHNDIVLNRTAKVYGFGSEIHQYKIDYKQLYIIEGNIELGYRLNKHKIKIGVRPSYALSSKVKVDEPSMNLASTDNEVVYSQRSVYGFMDGLNRFGLKPTIGYAYSITPSIELGLSIGVQLRPALNSDFIEGQNNKFPLDGQLYFRKSIDFRK